MNDIKGKTKEELGEEIRKLNIENLRLLEQVATYNYQIKCLLETIKIIQKG